MFPKFPKLLSYFTLLLLGGGLLAPVITYATLTLDSTSLTSDTALTLKSASSSATTLGDPNQSGTVTIASSTQTLTLNLGIGSGATTVNIATGTSTAKTINIGTGNQTINTITIGNASSSVAVSGTLRITEGNQGANKVLTSDASGGATWQNRGVPSGAIMFFNLASCPTGWTEDTASRGRYVVGLPSGGSLASTTGTALTDKENRAVGQHAHDITDPGHTHKNTMTGQDTPSGANYAGPGNTTGNTGSAATGISVVATGTTAGTNAPYIQYLACSKD